MNAQPQLKNLGVYATETEVAVIKSAMEPTGDPMAVPRLLNQYAMAHGLPETPDGYGLNLDTREFIGLE